MLSKIFVYYHIFMYHINKQTQDHIYENREYKATQ